MPRTLTRRTPAISPPDAITELERHRSAVYAAEAAETEAWTTYDQSSRWKDAAQSALRTYLAATSAGREEPDAARLDDLKARAEDCALHQFAREQIGNSTRYADLRAKAALDDALDATMQARHDLTQYLRGPARGAIEEAMLTRAESARDALLAALQTASSTVNEWHQVRRDWIKLVETWGGSPSSIPPLPDAADGYGNLQNALSEQQRAGGHVRHPRLLVPAPVEAQLADPADARVQHPADHVPENQRRKREA